MANLFNPEFEFTERQAEAWEYLTDNTYRNIGYWGAAWWWKSVLWTLWVWSMAMKYPWTRWFIGRKELSNIIKSTLSTYYKMLRTYNVPAKFMWKLDKKYNIIKFDNGSEILLLDCATQPSDPEFVRFGSLEMTWWFIDEAAEIDFKAVEILRTRIARWKNKEYGLLPKMLCTFNPDQWRVKQEFYTPRKSWTQKDGTIFIPALVTDNRFIDPEYIKQLQNTSDEITKQRLLYWNFDWSWEEWKLFRHDEINDLFEVNIEKKDVMYISCDVARLWDDKTVICIWRWLECIKIITYEKNTIDEIANRIKDLEAEYCVSRRNIVVDSDGVGGWLADLLRWCTNFVNNSRPYKLESEKKWYVLRNYANLKAQCYFKLKEMMEKREIRVYADGRVRDYLSQELENVFITWIWTDNKVKIEDKKDLKRRINRSPDFADAIMFRMIFLVQEIEERADSFTGTYEINYDDLLY